MRRATRKAVSLALAGVLALAAAAGCFEKTGPSSASQNDTPAPQPAPPAQTQELTGEITVYTSESQDLVTDMLEDFVSKNPGVTYKLFRSGSGAVISKIDTELETGSTEADIIWFADIGYMSQLDDKGLIQHYTPKGADAIDPKFNYNDGMAWEVRQIFSIIAKNTLKCDVEITDWQDLTKPELSGRFAMANPDYSGGAFTTMVGLVGTDGLGWQLYQDMKDNDVKFEQSNGNLQTKVSSGEYAAVSIVDFMARNAENEGSPVQTIWPASGAVMIPTPIAMLSTVEEENRAACEALLDYMLSEDAQKLFIQQGYIPVNPNVGVPEGAPDVADIKTVELDIQDFTQNSAAFRERFAEIYGEG